MIEKINLCDNCQFEMPTCGSKELIFGCDVVGGKPTDDNVICCDSYKQKSGTPDLNLFIEWAKQNPKTRSVDIHINSSTRSDFIAVWVYDKALQAGQHVKSVEEINLEDKKTVQERLEYERLKAKFEAALKAVS